MAALGCIILASLRISIVSAQGSTNDDYVAVADTNGALGCCRPVNWVNSSFEQFNSSTREPISDSSGDFEIISDRSTSQRCRDLCSRNESCRGFEWNRIGDCRIYSVAPRVVAASSNCRCFSKTIIPNLLASVGEQCGENSVCASSLCRSFCCIPNATSCTHCQQDTGACVIEDWSNVALAVSSRCNDSFPQITTFQDCQAAAQELLDRDVIDVNATTATPCDGNGDGLANGTFVCNGRAYPITALRDLPWGCYYKESNRFNARLWWNPWGDQSAVDPSRVSICGSFSASPTQSPTNSPTISPTVSLIGFQPSESSSFPVAAVAGTGIGVCILITLVFSAICYRRSKKNGDKNKNSQVKIGKSIANPLQLDRLGPFVQSNTDGSIGAHSQQHSTLGSVDSNMFAPSPSSAAGPQYAEIKEKGHDYRDSVVDTTPNKNTGLGLSIAAGTDNNYEANIGMEEESVPYTPVPGSDDPKWRIGHDYATSSGLAAADLGEVPDGDQKYVPLVDMDKTSAGLLYSTTDSDQRPSQEYALFRGSGLNQSTNTDEYRQTIYAAARAAGRDKRVLPYQEIDPTYEHPVVPNVRTTKSDAVAFRVTSTSEPKYEDPVPPPRVTATSEPKYEDPIPPDQLTSAKARTEHSLIDDEYERSGAAVVFKSTRQLSVHDYDKFKTPDIDPVEDPSLHGHDYDKFDRPPEDPLLAAQSYDEFKSECTPQNVETSHGQKYDKFQPIASSDPMEDASVSGSSTESTSAYATIPDSLAAASRNKKKRHMKELNIITQLSAGSVSIAGSPPTSPLYGVPQDSGKTADAQDDISPHAPIFIGADHPKHPEEDDLKIRSNRLTSIHLYAKVQPTVVYESSIDALTSSRPQLSTEPFTTRAPSGSIVYQSRPEIAGMLDSDEPTSGSDGKAAQLGYSKIKKKSSPDSTTLGDSEQNSLAYVAQNPAMERKDSTVVKGTRVTLNPNSTYGEISPG